MKTKIKNLIKTFPLPKILSLFRWKFIDLYRLKRDGKPPHLYGIRCITGMYGCGKTVTMTFIANRLRKKYGDNIYICSNYGLSIQDFPFECISYITIDYDKPIVFFWDEVQNDFPATEKVFPKEVRQALTLNRKGNGQMYYWASQDHELVHKTIRRLTIEYGKVRTIWNRYTKIRWYFKEDYEMLTAELDVDQKRKIKPIFTESFIQTDDLRNQYNSFGRDNGESIR